VIAQALTCAEQTEEGYAIAELHRIKGELLMKSSELARAGKLSADSSGISTLLEARASFDEALTIAKLQKTRSWELRAALSMYRLDLMLGTPKHARLAEIYSSFTEGFETADLKQARVQLKATAPA